MQTEQQLRKQDSLNPGTRQECTDTPPTRAMRAKRSPTEKRLKLISLRQKDPSWGREYIPSILAVRGEAPSASHALTITPEKLDELAGIESMLVTGEPVLLQQGVDWKLGVLDQDRIFFSNVNRRSHFDELTDGYQALLVRSFIDLRIDSKGTHKFGAKSVEPKDISPGAGNIGMPLVPRDTNTVELSQDMPDGMLAAFRNYSVTLGRPKAHGGRTYLDSLLVGKGVVEKGLGIPLEEVLNFVSNTALQAFITQPASGPAPVETL